MAKIIRKIRAAPERQVADIKKEQNKSLQRANLIKKHPSRRYLRHGQIRYEAKNVMVSGSETTDTSISAAFVGADTAVKSVETAAGVVRITRKSVGGVKKVHTGVSNIGAQNLPAHILMRNVLKKATGREARQAMLKVSGKSALEGIKSTTNNAIYTFESQDHTDSALGSINLAGRAVKTVADGASKTVRAGKTTKKAYRYTRNAWNVRQLKTAETARVAQTARATQTSKAAQATRAVRSARASRAIKTSRAISNTVSASAKSSLLRSITAKTVATIPKVVAALANPIGLIIGGAMLVMLIISSAAGGVSAIVGGVPLIDDDAIAQYRSAMDELESEFNASIEGYRQSSEYDEVNIEYMGEIGAVTINWREIITVIAVANDNNITFTNAEQTMLTELFNRLNYLSTRTEDYYCSGCVYEEHSQVDSCTGHTKLYVRVYCLSIEDVIDDVGLTDDQIECVRQMLTIDLSEIYPELGLQGIDASEGLSPEEIARRIAEAPTSSATRQQIYATALSLVGRVGYFWGGKSAAGWNDSWGTSVKVTAPGSEKTGTFQPFGLDCSGFTDWVYKTAGVGNILSDGGTAHQWSQSYAIAERELKVGDLVFKQSPGTSGTNHVGIFIGYDASTGKKQYVHCASGKGVTIDSYAGFKFWRRPYINFGD